VNRPLIVIPTYNEAVNISNLIPELLALDVNPDILVVDDNSPDGTGEAVLKFSDTKRVHLLSRDKKEGLGPAYVAGFNWALSANTYDAVVQMDADFSHPVAKVQELLSSLEEYDLVIGSRYSSGVNVVKE
jgi:dolichol-phosphate mannosyltransferase